MRPLALVTGILCISIVLFDAFQTIILPRRATGRFRLTRIFYIATWIPWSFFARHFHHARRREILLGYYGPLSLILLLVVWAAVMVLGFAFIYFAIGSPFNDPSHPSSFHTDLYVSGTTLFTLGLGDVTPHSPLARVLLILQSGMGFGFLAMVMGYFPSSTPPSRAAKSLSPCSTPGPAHRPLPQSSCAATPATAPRSRSPLSLSNGSAGPPSSSRATSPTRCSATTAPSTTVKAGSAPSPPSSIPHRSSSPAFAALRRARPSSPSPWPATRLSTSRRS